MESNAAWNKIVKIKGALNISSLETDSKTVYSDIGLYDFNNSYFDFKKLILFEHPFQSTWFTAKQKFDFLQLSDPDSYEKMISWNIDSDIFALTMTVIKLPRGLTDSICNKNHLSKTEKCKTRFQM